jgi:hypothetical protein
MADETAAAATTTSDAAAAVSADASKATDTTGADAAAKAAADATAAAKDGDKKTDADKTAADKQTDNKDAKAGEVPEKYTLKLPDGVLIDEPMMNEFTAWAKENKLTNAEAQKAAEMHMKAVGVFAAKQAQELATQRRAWVDEFKADKEVGGAKADEAVGAARKVLNVLGTPEEVARLKADLDRTGMGDHPVLVKGLRLFAQFVGDDNVIVGRPSASGPKDPVSVLYGNNSK